MGGRRVLIIVENLPVPFDRRVWLEATALRANGYEVTVICPRMKGFNAAYERLEGVHIYRYPLPVDAKGGLGFVVEFSWAFIASAWISLRLTVTGRGFDVLHACNPPDTFWLLARFWQLLGRRFIFDHHDLSPEMYEAKFNRKGGLLHAVLLRLERWSFRTADIVITTNESHKRIAVERGGKLPGDVYVVRSGPDFRRFAVSPPNSSYASGKKYLLTFLGEMCSQDNVEGLVRAVLMLRKQFKRDDFRCIFMGGGPDQARVAALSVELGLGDIITFTGRVSDAELCRVLSSATIGIDPTPRNSWSNKSTMNKIVEYMFFSLPVVAFDLDESRVSAGDAGIYVPDNSVEQLARAIDTLLDDPDRRAAMGEVGQARLRKTLSFENSIPNLLAAYARCFVGPQISIKTSKPVIAPADQPK